MWVGVQSLSPAALSSAKSPCTHCIGWVGSTAGLNGCGEEKNSCPHRTSNPKPVTRSNSLYRLRSLPTPSQVLVQVPNTDLHWNIFEHQDEISQVAYAPNNTQTVRFTHTKYSKYL